MKKRSKKKRSTKHAPPEYVSAAWIAKVLGVHASSVESAWARGELEVALFVTGGNGRSRPTFLRSEAERWFKERAK